MGRAVAVHMSPVRNAAARLAPASSPWKLALPALGVVYGDIGTSPLYTLTECFHGDHGVAPTPANILGVLSLIFWALTFTVSIKYPITRAKEAFWPSSPSFRVQSRQAANRRSASLSSSFSSVPRSFTETE